MSISESEELLFSEWRQKRPELVADGVVDENAYNASSPKLLFVLKEVNDPGGGRWDLREFVREGARRQTWDNIARWVEGIRRLPEDLPWENLEQVDEKRRQESLQTIAAMNLKKSPGGYTTDGTEVSRIATEDKAYLNRQFSLYDPDVVVCCGPSVSWILHQVVDLGSQPQWRTTRRGIAFHEFKPQKFVIEYCHPEARVWPCLLYYSLIDALREIGVGAPKGNSNSRTP